MVISIDHGNRQVKTVHKVFVSGLVESSVRPALGEDYILYNNSYFSLTEHRLAYRRDKCVVLDIGGFTADYMMNGCRMRSRRIFCASSEMSKAAVLFCITGRRLCC